MTLFYSRLELRPASRGAPWNKLRDVHEVHQALWSGFEGLSAGTPSPFLFRADRVRVGDEVRVRVLVQSEREPAWGRLGEVLVSADGPKVRDAAWLQDRCAKGSVRRFFLRANTTRSVRPWGPVRDTRGKRVAIEGDAEQRAWLVKRIEASGARLCVREVSIRRDDGTVLERRSEPELRTSNVRLWRWNGAKRGELATHQGVDFEGLIEVVDGELLAKAVVNGIGPAKGVGFGLLSLAPLEGSK
jgi:CRISPR system Cascade subunit CasE